MHLTQAVRSGWRGVLQMFNHGLTWRQRSSGFSHCLKSVPAACWASTILAAYAKPGAGLLCGLMGIALFSLLWGCLDSMALSGEFLIFRGVFPLSWVSATVSVLGLLITAAVILTVIQRVFTGSVPGAMEVVSRFDRLASGWPWRRPWY